MKKEFFLAFEEEKNFTPGPSRCVFSTFSVWRLTLLPPKETLWPPHRWLKNNEAQTISIILKTNICFFLHMLDCRVSSKSLIFFCKKNHISGPGDDTSEIFGRVGLDPSYFHTMIALGHISISFMSQFGQMSQKLAFGLVRIFGTSTNRGLPWKILHWNFRSNFLGDFLYMWTGQEKILGQKVNVKFFTVGPYVPLALVRQTILKTRVLAKYIWNINKRPNPQKINSLKDYMVDSQFLMSFDFFGF